MNIKREQSLKSYNSFGFEVSAEYFVSVETSAQLHEAISWSKQQKIPCFILGGGSNIVFTKNVTGLVIHIAIQEITAEVKPTHTIVKAGAGELWHGLVAKTLELGIYGLENLALIPGSAGAAPIQNIGAYGVEVGDLLESVEVYDKTTTDIRTLLASECQFGYRDSLFKTPQGENYIVTAITLKLSQQDRPTLSYEALVRSLNEKGIVKPTAKQVFDEVCSIRSAKLPDPQKIGNAGSFFKNPIISRQQLDTLIKKHPGLPHYSDSTGQYKVPAAWLIDRAGWKGYISGHVGVHNAQALVLVNHGGGNGQQIAILANTIKHDILRRYGIHLEREPTLY